MTPRDIILLALKDAGIVGVGNAASAEDMNDAFTRLNMMLGVWSARRWMVYHLIDVAKTSTGAASYTVGPGGDFNVARADRLEAAFARYLPQGAPNQIDYPLNVLQSREDYNRIALKGQAGFPSGVFLDTDYPLGTLYVWPIPTAGTYEIHITVRAAIAQFANLSDNITLPPSYLEALEYSLAVRLRAAYQLPPDPTIVGLARAAVNTVTNNNVQIPVIQMPEALRRGRVYNPYTDGAA